jgi:hypothetical protein
MKKFRRLKPLVRWGILAVVVVITASCSPPGKSAIPGGSPLTGGATTPGSAVLGYLSALNQGQINDAEAFVVPKGRQFFLDKASLSDMKGTATQIKFGSQQTHPTFTSVVVEGTFCRGVTGTKPSGCVGNSDPRSSSPDFTLYTVEFDGRWFVATRNACDACSRVLSSLARSDPSRTETSGCSPNIKKVSVILAETNPVMTVTGTCFGNMASSSLGQATSDLYVSDGLASAPNWTAGKPNDLCTITIFDWQDPSPQGDDEIDFQLNVNEDVVTLLDTGWGICPLNPGDSINVYVANPQTGAGPVSSTVTATTGITMTIDPTGTYGLVGVQSPEVGISNVTLGSFVMALAAEFPSDAISVGWENNGTLEQDIQPVAQLLDVSGTVVSAIEAVPEAVDWAELCAESGCDPTVSATLGLTEFSLNELIDDSTQPQIGAVFESEADAINSTFSSADADVDQVSYEACTQQGVQLDYILGQTLTDTNGALVINIAGISNIPGSVSLPQLSYYSYGSPQQCPSQGTADSTTFTVAPYDGTFSTSWALSLQQGRPPSTTSPVSSPSTTTASTTLKTTTTTTAPSTTTTAPTPILELGQYELQGVTLATHNGGSGEPMSQIVSDLTPVLGKPSLFNATMCSGAASVTVAEWGDLSLVFGGDISTGGTFLELDYNYGGWGLQATDGLDVPAPPPNARLHPLLYVNGTTIGDTVAQVEHLDSNIRPAPAGYGGFPAWLSDGVIFFGIPSKTGLLPVISESNRINSITITDANC